MGKATAVHYRCIAASTAGFLRQLAVGYLSRGYRYYYAGCIRDALQPERVDQKIITRYELATLSKDQRYRSKQKGIAQVQYLRYGRFYVLVATPGEHPFFQTEKRIEDIARKPIRFHGYTICYRHRLSVQLDEKTFKALRARCLARAPHWRCHTLEPFLREQFAKYECYGGVKDQFRQIIRQVNSVRKKSGYQPVQQTLFRRYPRPVPAFEPISPTEGVRAS